MNAQTVTVQTAAKLAAAGFPQPAPAPGQWWGDSEGLVFVFGETIPQPGKYWEDENGVMQPVGGLSPVVHYVDGGRPIIDDYFDARDFRGLVYLPTVGDILRELGAWKYLHIRDSAFLVSIECHLGTISHIRHISMGYNEHEAAAAAWIELKKQ